MPHDLFSPPPAVPNELDLLRSALDNRIPAKSDGHNLLIATWNICAFGNLTKNWTDEADNSPKRNFRWLYFITEIVRRFDVVAVQEVKNNLRAIRYMMKLLGPQWGFLLTDVTLGDKGNGERLAFVFDTTRVRPSGLAAEIVIPAGDPDYLPANLFQRQFVRTPYAASFSAGGRTFILVTLHVNYGDDKSDRIDELRAIANWISRWAENSYRFDHNLIVLGDFNIDRMGDELYEEFIARGLTVPDSLLDQPRTIFHHRDKPESFTFYDQIAWFTGAHEARLSLDYRGGGNFDFKHDFVRHVQHISNVGLKFRMSDHYPLWVEFGV
ncbi:MAG: endonuclease [Candidatus Glassbacteria bacterium]|nr:endonuclease [Candidatus Glassbacteria bacterium]